MVNRVLLDVGGLDVSKPGVDVLTATKQNLHFTSEFSHVREVVSGITRVTYGAAAITIPFGITFARLPYMDIWYKAQTGSAFGLYAYTTNVAEFGGLYLAYLTTSNLQLKWTSYPQSGITYWDIAYRVWGYSTP